jgi:hypothetical protein
MQGKSFRCGRMADFGDGSAGERVLRRFRFTTQDEIALLEPAPVRKVVQISTMVHAEKDWTFVALCGDGSMWLYHGLWSRIESIPQTADA